MAGHYFVREACHHDPVADAQYDLHADWYADYLRGPAAEHSRSTGAALAQLLGAGTGRCLDIGCGTGVHAAVLRDLGWHPLGIDLSVGQLRHARRHLPVAAGHGARLPVASAAVDAVVATLIHTDVADWQGTLREAARVLRPGGRFVYVGVHPCFVGPFAERQQDLVRIHAGYLNDRLTYQGQGLGSGIRTRVGVRHRTMADLVNAVVDTNLRIARLAEFGAGPIPELLGVSAVRP